MSARGFKPTDDATLGVKRDSQQRQPDSDQRAQRSSYADTALVTSVLSAVCTECDLHGSPYWNESWLVRYLRAVPHPMQNGVVLGFPHPVQKRCVGVVTACACSVVSPQITQRGLYSR